MAQVIVATDFTLDELLAQLAPTVPRDGYYTSLEWADYFKVSLERARAILHLAKTMGRLCVARDMRESLTGAPYQTWVYRINTPKN